MGFPVTLITTVILQKKRLLLRLRGVHSGGQPQATLAASAAAVVLASADESRPDAVENLDAPDKGKNGWAAGAPAVAGSLRSSMAGADKTEGEIWTRGGGAPLLWKVWAVVGLNLPPNAAECVIVAAVRYERSFLRDCG